MGKTVQGDKCRWIHSFHQEPSALIRLGVRGPPVIERPLTFQTDRGQRSDEILLWKGGEGRERTKSGGWWIENIPTVARSEDCVLATAPLPRGSSPPVNAHSPALIFMQFRTTHKEDLECAFASLRQRSDRRWNEGVERCTSLITELDRLHSRIPNKRRFPYSSLPYLQTAACPEECRQDGSIKRRHQALAAIQHALWDTNLADEEESVA